MNQIEIEINKILFYNTKLKRLEFTMDQIEDEDKLSTKSKQNRLLIYVQNLYGKVDISLESPFAVGKPLIVGNSNTNMV